MGRKERRKGGRVGRNEEGQSKVARESEEKRKNKKSKINGGRKGGGLNSKEGKRTRVK